MVMGVDWTDLALDSNKCHAAVNTAINNNNNNNNNNNTKLRNYRKQPYWALHTYFGKC